MRRTYRRGAGGIAPEKTTTSARFAVRFRAGFGTFGTTGTIGEAEIAPMPTGRSGTGGDD